MAENYLKYFTFFSEKEIRSLLENDKQSFVGIVPKGISDEKELMHVYYDKLNLAPYFGGNWDALDEVLHDFDWINAENIIIIHQDIPNLNPQDKIIMIKVLGEAVKLMAEGPRTGIQLPSGKHKLQVIFPESYKKEIEALFV